MADKPVKVEIVGDSSNYKKALKDAEDATQGFAGAAKSHGKAIAGALGGAAVVAGIHEVIDAASDYNETVSKSKVIFGGASDSVIKFADDAATSFGLSKQSALDAEATFATFGKGAGLAGDELGSFAQNLTGLAADMASFSNTKPEQAIEAIGAALRGEAEPIRAYGVLLDDATLRAQALKLGIYDGTGALTQQQKVLAAQAAIMAQTSDAQGDFARTSGGLAGQQKILAAEFDNLKVSLGQKLIPVATKAIQAFLSISNAASDMAFGVDLSTESFKKFFAEADSHSIKQIGDELHAMAKAADESHSFIGRLSSDLFDSRWDGVNEAFKTMGKESPAALRDVINELRDLQTQAENGDPAAQKLIKDYEITTQHLDDLYNAYIAVSPAQAETDRETKKLADSFSHLGDVTLTAEEAAKKEADALAEAKRKSDEFAKSLQGQIDKLDQLYPKQYDAVKAKYDYRDAQDTTTAAVDALNTVLSKHKSKQEDVTAATYAARDAILAQSEKFAGLDGAASGSEGAIRRQIQSLKDQESALSPNSPLRKFLDEYIADLAAIPSNISTIMDLHISSGAATTAAGDVIGKRSGARAAGGPVAAGGLYEVGEGGNPELFSQNGRSYLIPGNKGQVTPMAGASLTINNYRRDLTVADLHQLLAMARLAS